MSLYNVRYSVPYSPCDRMMHVLRVLLRSMTRLAAAVAGATSLACAGAARPSTPSGSLATPVRTVSSAEGGAGARTMPVIDGLPAGFREAFTDADSRARTIVYWYQCVGTVARLRAGGTFGPAAAAPRLIFCERTADGVPIGGVYDVDAPFTTVRRLSTVRLDGARPRYTGAIDTARVATEAKLVADVSRAITPTWTKLGRPFSVVPVPMSDGSMEAWAIPRATKARHVVTGGDVAYVRRADGSMHRTVDHTSSWTLLPIAAAGALIMSSAGGDVAAVADLVTARYLTDLGREITVQTATVSSMLVPGIDPATGARVLWRHVPIATGKP